MKLDKFSYYDLLQKGFKAKQAREVDKAGVWRAGSSGCILPKGVVVGTDPRSAVLRFLGIQMPTTYDKQLMFDAGFANEDYQNALIRDAGAEFRCEEEIPLVRTLPNGDPLTGRPDTVVGSMEGEIFIPELGIDHKALCAPFSAFDKASWGRGEADPTNVVQCCTYSRHFEIPWVLAYTSRVMHGFPFFAAANEEKFVSDPFHRAIMRDEKTGKPFMFDTFQSFYDIVLEDGIFLVDGEPTQITPEGIDAFYVYCADCVRNKEIPALRSGGWDHFGRKTRKNKTLLYDDFKEADGITDFDEWVEECRRIASGHN